MEVGLLDECVVSLRSLFGFGILMSWVGLVIVIFFVIGGSLLLLWDII